MAKGIEEKLIPLIHQDKHECLFLAIKDVLREDMSISDITLVGVAPGYEKNSILNQDSLYEAMTLANIITYAIIYNILSIDHMNYKRKSVKFKCQKVRR